MKPRIVYVHGNETMHWSGSFAGWLKLKLEKAGFPTFFETMPDSIEARAKYWLPFLSDYAKVSDNDVLVGWSSGAIAAMRYAEENKILGSVLIGSNYTDLGDESEKKSGFYDKPWNWKAISENQKEIAMFFGDYDPYIPQEEFEYVAKKLYAKVHKIENGRHFIEYSKFPQLLEYIIKTYK